MCLSGVLESPELLRAVLTSMRSYAVATRTAAPATVTVQQSRLTHTLIVMVGKSIQLRTRG